MISFVPMRAVVARLFEFATHPSLRGSRRLRSHGCELLRTRSNDMMCAQVFYVTEREAFDKRVKLFALVPPPPPPPPPFDSEEVGDYMARLSLWRQEKLHPRIEEACGN